VADTPGTPVVRDRAVQPPLSAWAKTLQRRLRQRGGNFFILHGPGARDIHPIGARRHGTIRDFLVEVMFPDRAVILTYDRGAGMANGPIIRFRGLNSARP
jgi:hypothetical protein